MTLVIISGHLSVVKTLKRMSQEWAWSWSNINSLENRPVTLGEIVSLNL